MSRSVVCSILTLHLQPFENDCYNKRVDTPILSIEPNSGGDALKYRYKLIINSLWAIPGVLVIRILKPFLVIRLCKIFSERVGHFISDISEQIARNYFNKPRTINIYYWGDVSNSQWEKMAKRSSLLIAKPWIKYLDRWNQLIPGGNVHTLKSSLTHSRDIEGLYQRYDASIPFLATENDEAHAWLISKGWKEGEPFICLLVRDSNYLSSTNPSVNWDYHDYRDSDISTYLSAVEWLAGQGVWVLRMGKIMIKPLLSENTHVIDYAFDPGRNDLLDIWLFANCTGVVSVGTGLDVLCAIYRKPQLFINAIPLAEIWSFSESIWAFKHVKWATSGRELTLNEHMQTNFWDTRQYRDAGLLFTDQTDEEILLAVQEFWRRISGTWIQPRGSEVLQERFWELFTSSQQYSKRHSWRHPNSRVGQAWLDSQSKSFFN